MSRSTTPARHAGVLASRRGLLDDVPSCGSQRDAGALRAPRPSADPIVAGVQASSRRTSTGLRRWLPDGSGEHATADWTPVALSAQPTWTGNVTGLDVAMPLVVLRLKSTSWAPAGMAVGTGRVLVVSSSRRNGIDPRSVPPASTRTVPTQPPEPVPQAELDAGHALRVGVDARAEDGDLRGEPVPGWACWRPGGLRVRQRRRRAPHHRSFLNASPPARTTSLAESAREGQSRRDLPPFYGQALRNPSLVVGGGAHPTRRHQRPVERLNLAAEIRTC
jgi:hypothetical protein